MKQRTALAAVLVCCCLIPVLLAEPLPNNTAPEPSAEARLPITISKETTYITGPLCPDGYPDYVAALNPMASEGVTPENNAAVALVEVFGPHAIESRDREKYFKMIGITPPPKKGKYFADYEDFVNEHAPDSLKESESPDGLQTPLALRQFFRAMDNPWSKAECPLVAAWLAENEKPLVLLLEASKRSRLFIPIISPGDGDMAHYCSFDSELRKQISLFRNVSRALKARALLRIHDGDVLHAWDDLQTCHRLSRLLAQGPTLVHRLVAATIEGFACDGDRQLAHYTNLTSEQALALRGDVEKLPSLPPTVDAIITDRFQFLDLVCASARGNMKPKDLLQTPPSGVKITVAGMDSVKLRGLLTEWIDSGLVNWNTVMRLGNEHFDRMAAAARKTKLSERVKAVDDLDEEFDVQAARLQLDAGANNHSPQSTITKKVAVAYSAIILDSVKGLIAVDARVAIGIQSTPIALALSAYRTDHSRYPNRLEDLSPKYLPRIPLDPCGDGPFKYHRTDDGYIIYSVGLNGRDDSGPPFLAAGSKNRGNSDDYGFQIPEQNE